MVTRRLLRGISFQRSIIERLFDVCVCRRRVGIIVRIHLDADECSRSIYAYRLMTDFPSLSRSYGGLRCFVKWNIDDMPFQ